MSSGWPIRRACSRQNGCAKQFRSSKRLSSADGARATGPRRKLTFAALESTASASSNGRVALTYQNREEHIWRLPIDDRGRATGDLTQLTFGFKDNGPSLSRDGHKLAFLSSSAGSTSIYYRDLVTNKQRLLPSVSFAAPILNPEGTKIVFGMLDGGLFSFYEEPVMGGAARKLWGGTKDWLNLYSWSPDGATLMFNRDEGGAAVVRELDLRTLKETPFLEAPEFEIWDGQFSHDEPLGLFQRGEGGAIANLYRAIPQHNGAQKRLDTRHGGPRGREANVFGPRRSVILLFQPRRPPLHLGAGPDAG